MSTEAVDNPRYHSEGISGPICLALFEVPLDRSHLVRHMGEADDGPISRLCEGVKPCRLHFDGEDAACPRRGDGGFGLAERGIGGPSRPGQHAWAVLERIVQAGEKPFRRGAPVRGREVVIARALIAQRSVDQNEIWRRASRSRLSGVKADGAS